MQRWAPYRLVDTHVKLQYRSVETRRLVLEKWPFEKIFDYSLPQVIEMNQAASRPGARSDLGVLLAELDRGRLVALSTVVAESGLDFSEDIQVFFDHQELKRLLNGVRDKVLLLLDEAGANLKAEGARNG